MRVMILSDADSIHTRRWVTSLSQRGCEILLFNLLKCDLHHYEGMPGVRVYSCGFVLNDSAEFSQQLHDKFVYIKAIGAIRRQARAFRPDFLHAHYACSFGLLGALSGLHPYVLSVWGSDVYDYPRNGWLYKMLLRYTLHKADYLLSTSHCMARETQRYTQKPLLVTPFGVDMQRFRPVECVEKPSSFVIGTVKTLKACYGIDTLIRAFSKVVKTNPTLDVRLLIAGTGPDKALLESLCVELGIRNQVDFLGYIQNENLPELYARFDVAVSLSRAESFGVVAVEAMSCGCPVVTSDAEGFREVVDSGVTGFVVPKENPQAAAVAIQHFIDDPTLHTVMGMAARKRVGELYDWEKNVDAMMAIYRQVWSDRD